ncbi:MAG: DUF523 domain-containing protein [Myxococcota bacterium]
MLSQPRDPTVRGSRGAQVRLGISSCLLGWRVRWDGDHRLDAALLELFRDQVEWIPVCPELEAGLGVPRAPIRLERRDDGVHAVECDSGRDWTAALLDASLRRVRELEALDLAGYILKSGSPSCGLRDVPVGREGGIEGETSGLGLYADTLVRRLPGLPLIEAGELRERECFARFVSRVFRSRRESTTRPLESARDPRERLVLARFDRLAAREHPD